MSSSGPSFGWIDDDELGKLDYGHAVNFSISINTEVKLLVKKLGSLYIYIVLIIIFYSLQPQAAHILNDTQVKQS